MDQIDNYIQSFLDGSLNAEEHTALQQWIKANPENRTYFHHTVSIWKAAGIVANADGFDVEKAIGRFDKETKHVTIKRIDRYKYALRVSAAAIIFLLGGISPSLLAATRTNYTCRCTRSIKNTSLKFRLEQNRKSRFRTDRWYGSMRQ